MASAGRRPGPNETRDDILIAARRLFAERGYDAATVRAIASAAGVNPALVRHFFGSKEGLFAAALELPVNPSEIAPMLMDGPVEEFGWRVAGFLMAVWRNPQTRAPLLALVRSSTTNEQAARMFREFVGTALVRRVADGLGISRTRLTAAIGQTLGLLLLRYVIRVEPLASAGDDEIAELIATTIQHTIERA